MAEEPRWGEDTVPIGAAAAEASKDGAEVAQRPAASREGDGSWGEDTAVLGIGTRGAAEAPGDPDGRREPARRRLPSAVMAIGVAAVVLIGVSVVLGGGGSQTPAPVAPAVEPDRAGDGAQTRHGDRGVRRAEREELRERIARERQQDQKQQRERRAKQNKARQAAERSMESAPNDEAEYVPEYAPEAAAVPEAAPAAPPPTPPAVEFGM